MYIYYFWKGKSLFILNLFISDYLDQIPPWKETKEEFSVTLQTENLLGKDSILRKIREKQGIGE